MASHHLIDTYLDELRRRLTDDAVDELADGLYETWHHFLGQGLTATDAAHAAIAEFGSPTQITGAFVSHSSGRTTARLLLATGPVVGASWGASLVAARAWSWPVPTAAAGAFALTLVGVVALLVAAATSRHDHRRTRLGHVGAVGLMALDIAMLAAVPLVAPVIVWPMAVAMTASLVRIAITGRTWGSRH
jgi:hypothetical protein